MSDPSAPEVSAGPVTDPPQVLARFRELLGWTPNGLYQDGELTHAAVELGTLEQLLNDHETVCVDPPPEVAVTRDQVRQAKGALGALRYVVEPKLSAEHRESAYQQVRAVLDWAAERLAEAPQPKGLPPEGAEAWDLTRGVHPGRVLREALIDRGMTQAALAEALGCDEPTVSRVINGRADISASFALRLEGVLGSSAEFWARLQVAYDLHMARGEAPASPAPEEAP